MTGVVPDADLFQLPVLYGRTIDVGHHVVDGGPGQLLAKQIAQRLNAHVIGPWLDLGFFNWYSTSRSLASYGDLKGLKIRNNGGAGQAWRTQFMGAIPNTTPLPNVPLGLSQGAFDGLITTHETVVSGQFWESGIRHALEDHQFVGEYIPIVSLAFWQKLPADLQQAFTGLWLENVARYRADMAAAQSRARNLVQAHGIKIVVPPAEELTAVRQDMTANQEQVARLSKISPEMVAAVSAGLAAAG
jgi:C4-dicarboxylate-binding protein DctP